MNDNCEKILRLQNLRLKIPELCNRPPLSSDFVKWHDELVKLVREVFGVESDENRDISALKFEIDPNALDTYSDTLGAHSDLSKLLFQLKRSGKAASKKLSDEMKQLFESPEASIASLQQQYYVKQLWAADEMLGAMILSLTQCNK